MPHLLNLLVCANKINSADRPLSDALRLMDDEGISSVAVVDNHFNVVGNISTTDVKVC